MSRERNVGERRTHLDNARTPAEELMARTRYNRYGKVRKVTTSRVNGGLSVRKYTRHGRKVSSSFHSRNGSSYRCYRHNNMPRKRY